MNYNTQTKFNYIKIFCSICLLLLFSCKGSKKTSSSGGNLDYSPAAVCKKARDYIGTPYKFSGMNPKKGFDCSGFVNYVYSQFNVKLPRTTSDQIKQGKSVSLKKARKGDLIFFKGSNANSRKAGHVGIIVSTDNEIKFIHASTSRGVIISSLSTDYYKKRFIKVKRLK